MRPLETGKHRLRSRGVAETERGLRRDQPRRRIVDRDRRGENPHRRGRQSERNHPRCHLPPGRVARRRGGDEIARPQHDVGIGRRTGEARIGPPEGLHDDRLEGGSRRRQVDGGRTALRQCRAKLGATGERLGERGAQSYLCRGVSVE